MSRVLLGRGVSWRILEIDHWWREHYSTRPRAFVEEWNQAYHRLRELPLSAPISPRPKLSPLRLRRLLLEGCQHYIYYLYEPPPIDEVIIVALRSTRRK